MVGNGYHRIPAAVAPKTSPLLSLKVFLKLSIELSILS